ncbi:MAG TPA: flagellar basal body protein [Ramlibacter sp.]|nr:flagellar basal body protein [Ramlibacter sp.]
MPHGLEALTTATLSLALDAASLRQRALAANIANHATPGYVPVKVDFDAQMQEAKRALDSRGSVDAASLAGVQLHAQPALDVNGQPVKLRLDALVADMAQNSVQYQALSKALGRHFSILSSAVSDGKR